MKSIRYTGSTIREFTEQQMLDAWDIKSPTIVIVPTRSRIVTVKNDLAAKLLATGEFVADEGQPISPLEDLPEGHVGELIDLSYVGIVTDEDLVGNRDHSLEFPTLQDPVAPAEEAQEP